MVLNWGTRFTTTKAGEHGNSLILELLDLGVQSLTLEYIAAPDQSPTAKD